MANAEQVFRAKAPGIMAQLIRDFPELLPIDAAAILGNLGHESGGLVMLQEIKPTVKGSAGGYGWAQWTGPRRRAYEAWCKRTGKNPASDEANYAYLFLELKGIEGSEGAAIRKVIGAGPNLEAKVIAFEKAFLRAGIKHYPSRLQWAERAMQAWQAIPGGVKVDPAPKPAPIPVPPLPEPAKGKAAPVVLIITAVLIALAIAGAFFIRF